MLRLAHHLAWGTRSPFDEEKVLVLFLDCLCRPGVHLEYEPSAILFPSLVKVFQWCNLLC